MIRRHRRSAPGAAWSACSPRSRVFSKYFAPCGEGTAAVPHPAAERPPWLSWQLNAQRRLWRVRSSDHTGRVERTAAWFGQAAMDVSEASPRHPKFFRCAQHRTFQVESASWAIPDLDSR